MERLERHLMLDFETLSLKKNAMLLSCGVVLFSRDEERLNQALWHIDLAEQKFYGRDMDPATLYWWLQQSDEARARAFVAKEEQIPISKFLFELREFVFWNDVTHVWCKGPAADAAWLEDLSDDAQVPCPVSYRYWRDVRTIEDRLPAGLELDLSDIVPHDPISDCIAQIRSVRASWSN